MTLIRCYNERREIREVPVEKFVFRPSAYGLILHEGNILAMKNRLTAKFWFPGGGIEMNESLEDGLRREIKEETGLTDILIGEHAFMEETFFYYEPDDEGYHSFLSFYLCTLRSVPQTIVGTEPDAVLHEAEWIPIQKITPENINDLTQSGHLATRVCQALKRFT